MSDLGIYVVPGREKDPTRALTEVAHAERLGFRRVWYSERWDTKEAGVLGGALAAVTSRVGIASGMVAAGSRHPLLTAALGASLQMMSGGRFILGLGRSDKRLMTAQSMTVMGYQAFTDYIDIVRRLWRGETVSYHGPAGRYDHLRMADPPPDPPPIWTGIYAGPRAAKMAAAVADGVVIMNFFTPGAVRNSVAIIRRERERLGLDPAVPVCACVISAPGADEAVTANLTAARFLTYVVGLPETADAFARCNGWDGQVLEGIGAHRLFSRMKSSIGDQSFHRHELAEVAGLVPRAWMRETCAIGSVDDCVAKLEEFRAAGADEIALHGSSPADNAGLVAAWRER